MSGRTIDRMLFIRTSRADLLSIVPPLGLLYLVGALRRDLLPPPSAVRVVDYALLGLNPRRLSELLEEFAPDLVGLSGLTVEADLMVQVARLARGGDNRPLVVAGGPHPTSDPGHLLARGLVDFVVRGEGEQTLPELVACLRGGGDPRTVPGLALPGDGGTPEFTAPRPLLGNLDQLPPPAWDTIRMADYSARPVYTMSQSLKSPPAAVIMTSRGCPFGCVYCHKFFGRKVRARSPEHVLDEMELLYQQHGAREFHLLDDFFNFDLERVRAICRMITERGLQVSLAFPNGIRGDHLDEETLRAMKRAGTYKIYVAVESGSERVQKYIGKRMKLDLLQRNITLASRLGIIVSAFFMIGFPTETREEMQETIRFAAASRLNGANFFKVVPFPGTKLAEMWAETYQTPAIAGPQSVEQGDGGEGYKDFCFMSRSLPAPPERMMLVDAMQAWAYCRFFGNPLRSARYVLRHPNRGLSLNNLWSMFRNVTTYYRDRWFRPELMRENYFGGEDQPAAGEWSHHASCRSSRRIEGP